MTSDEEKKFKQALILSIKENLAKLAKHPKVPKKLNNALQPFALELGTFIEENSKSMDKDGSN